MRRAAWIALAVALVAGVVAGAVAAAGGGGSSGGAGGTGAAGGAGAAGAGGPIVVVDPSPPQLPRVPAHGGGREYRPGSVRIVDRVPDPHGGPDWAVRLVEARETYDGHVKSRWLRCGQLGRVVGRAFGWIVPGTRRLDPVGLGEPWLGQCEPMPIETVAVGGTRSGGVWRTVRTIPAERWPLGLWSFQALVADPLGPEGHLAGSVAWALLPRDVRAGTAWIAGAAGDRLPVRDGVAIAFGPSSAHRWDVRLRAARGSGPVRTTAPLANGRGFSVADARDLRVIARAADPAGGLPLGIAGRRLGNGRLCTTAPGSLVDGRVGQVEGLGLLVDDAACQGGVAPSRRLPFAVGQTAQRGEDEGQLPGTVAAVRARAGARRTRAGDQTVLYGRVLPGIVRVQIATPSDVRTLRVGPSHAILAVWDLSFPPGARAALTGTFADGHRTIRHIRLASTPG